jgi:hypothetical protein
MDHGSEPATEQSDRNGFSCPKNGSLVRSGCWQQEIKIVSQGCHSPEPKLLPARNIRRARAEKLHREAFDGGRRAVVQNMGRILGPFFR